MGEMARVRSVSAIVCEGFFFEWVRMGSGW